MFTSLADAGDKGDEEAMIGGPAAMGLEQAKAITAFIKRFGTVQLGQSKETIQ